jgi:hypothetical protein
VVPIPGTDRIVAASMQIDAEERDAHLIQAVPAVHTVAIVAQTTNRFTV